MVIIILDQITLPLLDKLDKDNLLKDFLVIKIKLKNNNFKEKKLEIKIKE
jgi:hypothetical protein